MRKYSSYWGLLLFVFVVGVLFVNSSTCYALSSQDIIDYIDNTSNFFSNNSNYQLIKNYINNSVDAKNWLSQYANEYSNFCISTYYYRNYQYYQLKLFTASNGKINGDSYSLTYTGSYRTTLFRGPYQDNNFASNDNNASIDGGYCYSSNSNYENNLTGMAYITQEIVGNLPNTFVGNQAIPQFLYLEFNNDFENSAYNGNIYTYYYLGDFYSNSEIKLGEIIPNDSYYFEIRLKDSKTSVIKGTSYVALNTTPYTFYNDSGIYINEDFVLYAIPRLLNYNTQYQLEIISYYGEGNTNLQEDIDWFIFLPENAIVSGDIISSLGSGDFTNKDNANNIIDNQNSIKDEIVGLITNFDNVSSGDIINSVDIVPIYEYSSGDSIANFFVDILQKISEVFLLDDEVTLQITLPIFADTIYVRSDFWITSNYLHELAEFVNGAWWLLICIGMVYKIDVLVELYNFGDFINASYQLYQTRRLL